MHLPRLHARQALIVLQAEGRFVPLREPRPVQVQHVERGEHLHRVVMPVVNNHGINDRRKERGWRIRGWVIKIKNSGRRFTGITLMIVSWGENSFFVYFLRLEKFWKIFDSEKFIFINFLIPIGFLMICVLQIFFLSNSNFPLRILIG